MPWDSIKHLVRSSQGNGGSLVVDVAVSGEQTPCSKSPGGSILGWHPLAPLPAASLCASIQGLHAASPVPLTPLLQTLLSKHREDPRKKKIQHLKTPQQQGTSHDLKQFLKLGSRSCCLQVQSCSVLGTVSTCLRERFIAELLSHQHYILYIILYNT